MKIIINIIFTIQILVTPVLASKVLFVQNFENNTKDPKYEETGKALANMIISDLVELNTEGVQIVERSRIDSLIGELKLQTSEYFDKRSIQKMGKGLGANLALAGSFVVMAGEMRIDARLIDVATSEIQLAFKAKGPEDTFWELEKDLISNIGKGLAVDIKTIRQDKLTGPSTLGALVKYGDAIGLMDKGDYKAASVQLSDVRKDEPKFKLGESAYKEAMRKLYESKGKRENILSEAESKLLESALQKSKTDNPKVGFAYQWVLMEIYFRQMKKIVGIDPNNFSGSEALSQGWVRQLSGSKHDIPENDMVRFTDNMNLYIQAYLTAITHASKLDQMTLMGIYEAVSSPDQRLIKDLGWKGLGIVQAGQFMLDDLATFLLVETDFTPPPYRIDEKLGALGFELFEKATKEAQVGPNLSLVPRDHPNFEILEKAMKKNLTNNVQFDSIKVRDTGRIMEHHGDILLIHGREADAVAKWQEILDKYPTYENFDKVENKIKKTLE